MIVDRYRCPRTRHIVSLEICEGRKARKHFGCGTCKLPGRVKRDITRLAKIRVERFTDNTKAKNPHIRIAGLAISPTTITPGVARGLIKKLEEVL